MSTDYTELAINVSTQTGITDLPAHFARLCAMAERDIFKKLRVAEMETTIMLATDGATELPVDCLDILHVQPATGFHRLARASLLDIELGREGFAVAKRTLTVYPPSNSVLLTYYAKPEALETADTNWLLEAEPEIYLHACAFQAYVWKNQIEQAQASKSYYRELLDELQDADTLLRYKDQIPGRSGNAP